MLTTLLLIIAALLLDAGLGEPRRWHPLVGFGALATTLERALYGSPTATPAQRRVIGALIVALLLLPVTYLACWISQLDSGGLWSLLGLYLCLGRTSLRQHMQAIAQPLSQGDLASARRQTARVVSRDTDTLDPADIAKAATESALENGHDALFATLFWFAVAGLPGALLHRLANTLDAMWGYRNSRYRDFGWAAARLDDLLGWLPARLTALAYAVCGDWNHALDCWRRQAPAHDSPNAGPVMAAGAGALGVQLGGASLYQGQRRVRPAFGGGRIPQSKDIERALQLLDRALLLWLAVLLALSLGGLA